MLARPGGSTDVGRRWRRHVGRRRWRPPRARRHVERHRPGAQFMGIPPEIEEQGQSSSSTRSPTSSSEDVPFTQVYDETQKPFTLRPVPRAQAVADPRRADPHRVGGLLPAVRAAPRGRRRQRGHRPGQSTAGSRATSPSSCAASLLYFGLLVGAIVIGAIRTAWSGRIGEDLLYGLRVRVFSHIQRLSLDYFTDEKAGRIMTRVTSDIEAIQVLFQQGLMNMCCRCSRCSWSSGRCSR